MHQCPMSSVTADQSPKPIVEWVMSHKHESRHIRTSHITCEWVIPRMTVGFHPWQLSKVRNPFLSESCRICMSHATYEFFTSYMIESCHVQMPPILGDSWSKSETHLWKTTNVQEPRHMKTSHVTYEQVTSHVREPCHVWRSHVTCHTHRLPSVNESCHM